MEMGIWMVKHAPLNDNGFREKYLFTATDVGPYAYSMETEEWFDIAGLSAPLQQYISVEYLPSEKIIRFVTWFRGIWDFDMINTSGIAE